MRLAFLPGVAAAFAATAALADDPLAVYYGNTIVFSTPKGEMGRQLVNPDHTFISYQPSGLAVKGTWAVNNNVVCYTRTDPAPRANEQGTVCRPLRPHKVGDSWTINQNGVTMNVTLRAGR